MLPKMTLDTPTLPNGGDNQRSWIFECIRAMTFVYDEDENCLVPSFYINWLGWRQTLKREPLSSLDYGTYFEEFCQHVDERCINSDDCYPEGTVIHPTQEYKNLAVLRAIEAYIDLDGYLDKIMTRRPEQEAAQGSQWAVDDRLMDEAIAWFRQHLTERVDFSLLGEWTPLSHKVISKSAHDYKSIRKRRKAKIALCTTSLDTAGKADTLFREIFEAATFGTIRAQYQQLKERYISNQEGAIHEEQVYIVPDINFAQFEYSTSERQLQYSVVDGYPIHLQRIIGAELWNTKEMFTYDEKAEITKIVKKHFGHDKVWRASKSFRPRREVNQTCQIWRDTDSPAEICTECWHWFEKNALLSHFKAQNAATCPSCRTVLTIAPFPVAAIAPPPRARHRKRVNNLDGEVRSKPNTTS